MTTIVHQKQQRPCTNIHIMGCDYVPLSKERNKYRGGVATTENQTWLQNFTKSPTTESKRQPWDTKTIHVQPRMTILSPKITMVLRDRIIPLKRALVYSEGCQDFLKSLLNVKTMNDNPMRHRTLK